MEERLKQKERKEGMSEERTVERNRSVAKEDRRKTSIRTSERRSEERTAATNGDEGTA